MNRINNKETLNASISSSNGTPNRISNLGLMNGDGQLVYRRSPISQLQSNHHQTSTSEVLSSQLSNSYNSDEISEIANSFEEENINDLSIKFEQLQRQVEVLTQTQTTQDERYKRSRQENDVLLNRIHSLEDQLRELELGSEARAKEDEKRFRYAMAKQLKVQSQECEQHLHANFLLQQDLFKLKNELLKSEALIKALRSEKETLELELQEKSNELSNLDEELHKLKQLARNLKDEECAKSTLISMLNEELEDSRNRSQKEQQHHHQQQQQQQFDQSQLELGTSSSSNSNDRSPKQRLSSSRRSSVTSGFGEDFSSSNNGLANNKALRDIDGLEMTLEKIREENRALKDLNEELQAQLLNFQLEEGRSLVQEGNKSYSLADEMGDIDVQRLMKALKEQQDDNARLRKYMDEILLKIVDKNPEILDKTISSEQSYNFGDEMRPVA